MPYLADMGGQPLLLSFTRLQLALQLGDLSVRFFQRQRRPSSFAVRFIAFSCQLLKVRI